MAPKPVSIALDGPKIGFAAEDALEAILAGLGAIVAGAGAQGERPGPAPSPLRS